MATKPTVDPKWSTNNVATDNIEPTQSYKDGGVVDGGVIGREHLNWQFFAISQWVDWVRAYALDKDNNLSDLTSVSAARTNLGLDSATTTIGANTTGNAATTTKLKTARTIGGVSFDGTSNINLPGVNTTGNQNTTGSASKWTSARTISLSGDATGQAAFDGSSNFVLPVTISNDSHTHSASTITSLPSDMVGATFGATQTSLFNGNVTAGNIPLSEPCGNFRWLYFEMGNDGNDWAQGVLVNRSTFSGNTSPNNDFEINAGVGDYWRFDCTTGSTLYTVGQNSRIYKVTGIGRI